jgi:Ala-tRNA(Pro) deacylase
MAAQSWIKQALTAHEAPFQELHHGIALTAQDLAEAEHVSGHNVAKIVIVVADGELLQVVLPASRIVDLAALRGVIGAGSVRLATEREMAARFGDCELGAMPPMRRWPGVEVLMDESLRTSGDIVFAAGTHQDAIQMRFDDWFSLVVPRTGHVSRFATPARSDTGALAEFPEYEDWEV